MGQNVTLGTTRRVRSYRLTGIVLARRDLGEADRLITLLTPEQGQKVLRAKGVRKVTSRKAGHLDLFTYVRLQVARAQTWDIITQAETVRQYPRIRNRLRRMSHAYYLAELTLRLAPEGQSDLPLFDLVLETLEHLDQAPNLLLVSRWFEAQVLRVTGFQPQLYVCTRCSAVLDVSVTNYWAPAEGGALCPHCGEGHQNARPLPPRLLKLMRYFSTHHYDDVRTLSVRPQVLRELEVYIQAYLHTVIEGELRSMRFIRRLRQEFAHSG